MQHLHRHCPEMTAVPGAYFCPPYQGNLSKTVGQSCTTASSGSVGLCLGVWNISCIVIRCRKNGPRAPVGSWQEDGRAIWGQLMTLLRASAKKSNSVCKDKILACNLNVCMYTVHMRVGVLLEHTFTTFFHFFFWALHYDQNDANKILAENNKRFQKVFY